MKTSTILLALCVFAAVSVASEAPTSRPAVSVVVREIHDKSEGANVAVKIDADTLHVYAISPKGIGGTRLELIDGQWPSKVKVHLRYAADRPFKILEGPGASLERVGANVNDPRVNLPDLKRVEGGFEFVLPATELKVLYISWVDAYR